MIGPGVLLLVASLACFPRLPKIRNIPRILPYRRSERKHICPFPEQLAKGIPGACNVRHPWRRLEPTTSQILQWNLSRFSGSFLYRPLAAGRLERGRKWPWPSGAGNKYWYHIGAIRARRFWTACARRGRAKVFRLELSPVESATGIKVAVTRVSPVAEIAVQRELEPGELVPLGLAGPSVRLSTKEIARDQWQPCSPNPAAKMLTDGLTRKLHTPTKRGLA